MRATALLLLGVMILNASCASLQPRTDETSETDPAGRGTQVSMAGGLMSLLAVTTLIIGATQVKDKSARAWIWSGLGGLFLAGMTLERGERIKEQEKEREADSDAAEELCSGR